MAKYDKPFHVRLVPDWNVREVITEEESARRVESTKELGGMHNSEGEYTENSTITASGGRFDWQLYREDGTHKEMVNVQLMRTWTVTMITQMINDKAFTNEADAGIEFGLSDEERNITLSVMQKLHDRLNDEITKADESLVLNKKIPKPMM